VKRGDQWCEGACAACREPAAEGDAERAAAPAPPPQVDGDTGGQAPAQGTDSQAGACPAPHYLPTQ